ncbi:MAG: hypothetical protein OXH66_10055 [Gemmatimonadetes bacterium]|nr:hypothetical protein [Gemmatimonadota bacterium]
MIDPTVELLQAMASVGLHPKGVVWDSNWHRFPGIDQKRGDNGRYKAFVDQRGALFMDMRTGQSWKWPQDFAGAQERMKEHFKPMSGEEVRRKQEAYEKERAEKEGKHLRAIRNLWERAKDCANHPYLGAKGIRNVPLLKSIIDPDTEQEMLLIPMRDADGELRCLQRVWPNGDRLYMPQAGGVKGLYNTIGSQNYMQSKTLYICEGWATGWTIHKASGCAVIVAFTYSGLLTVGRIIQEKYPEARIVFAADNDRWKLVKRDGALVNIGVYAAKRAAQALNAEYCIPDFPDLSTQPTDYDDLRQLADLAVVRDRLDPAKADQAVITPPPDDPPDDEPPEEPDEDAHWSDSFPSQFLGSLSDTYYFLSERSGQVLSFTAFRKTDMLKLAPLSWYEDHFGTRTKRGVVVSWDEAVDAIIDQASHAGTYGLDKLRGRGYWPEDDKPLLHLGDRMWLPDGTQVAPHTYRGGNRIYPQLPRLEGPADRPLPLASAKWVLNLFESLLWEMPAAGALAAGWTVMAPLSGYLRWRPSVWITGPAGCGKTSIIEQIMLPLTGGMGILASGTATTEAGLRQELGTDALPVLIDEAGRDDKGAQSRINRIILLMRGAASPSGRIFKGTQHGGGLNYQIRSMFCLGSVGGALRDAQDQQRITLLHLRHPRTLGDKDKQDRHWHPIQREINRITPRLARMLLARAQQWARSGRLERLLATTKTAAGAVLGTNRAGDQFGTLLAGALILREDKIPDEESVIAWLKDLGLEYHIEEIQPEGREILDLLFQVQEIVSTSNGSHKTSVGEMVTLVVKNARLDGAKGLLGYDDAKRHLRDIGLLVEGDSLYVANKSVWIRRALRDTSFSEDHASLLRVMAGAGPGPRHRFAGRQSRTTRIPIRTLDITGAQGDLGMKQ